MRNWTRRLAIGAALATQCLAENESLLAELVHDDNLSSSEKLTAFTMKQLHYTYDYFESAPKLAELVEVMATQRPDVIETHRQHTLVLLEQLLIEGQQSGEFVFDDLMETREAVLSATLLFYFPLTMSLFPLAVLEQKATRVCQLLLRGLKPIS